MNDSRTPFLLLAEFGTGRLASHKSPWVVSAKRLADYIDARRLAD